MVAYYDSMCHGRDYRQQGKDPNADKIGKLVQFNDLFTWMSLQAGAGWQVLVAKFSTRSRVRFRLLVNDSTRHMSTRTNWQNQKIRAGLCSLCLMREVRTGEQVNEEVW